VFILCISPKPFLYSPHVCFIDSKTKTRLAHPLTLKTKVKVSNYADAQEVKTESIRKLSNFNFQWTKTLYQNNLNNVAFFFTVSRAVDIISYL